MDAIVLGIAVAAVGAVFAVLVTLVGQPKPQPSQRPAPPQGSGPRPQSLRPARSMASGPANLHFSHESPHPVADVIQDVASTVVDGLILNEMLNGHPEPLPEQEMTAYDSDYSDDSSNSSGSYDSSDSCDSSDCDCGSDD